MFREKTPHVYIAMQVSVKVAQQHFSIRRLEKSVFLTNAYVI